MKFKLVIDCDNAAFEPAPENELRRILHNLVIDINQNWQSIRDINGNTVGAVTITE